MNSSENIKRKLNKKPEEGLKKSQAEKILTDKELNELMYQVRMQN